jgi:hypothetical protein
MVTEEFQRLGREDHRLNTYHVTVSYRGIFDILYTFTACNQHEITDASHKKTKELTKMQHWYQNTANENNKKILYQMISKNKGINTNMSRPTVITTVLCNEFYLP